MVFFRLSLVSVSPFDSFRWKIIGVRFLDRKCGEAFYLNYMYARFFDNDYVSLLLSAENEREKSDLHCKRDAQYIKLHVRSI